MTKFQKTNIQSFSKKALTSQEKKRLKGVGSSSVTLLDYASKRIQPTRSSLPFLTFG
jgi:hypothetical protein